MGLAKVASKSAFKATKEFTGGADAKLFKILSRMKGDKKKLAKEILWFLGACVIAFISGFIIYYLIGEFLTETFVNYVQDFGSITKFYFVIFFISLGGVYFARLVIWAVKTVAQKS